MRRRPLFIVALAALITFVSLQAFIGHRYYRLYGWHRGHHWDQWPSDYDHYGPGSRSGRHYDRFDNRWNSQRRHVNPPDQADSSTYR